MHTLWEHRFAQRTERMAGSAIRELLKLTESPDVISFAGGLPAPEVFPKDEFLAAATRVLTGANGALALQYGTTEGYRPLREMIARHTARYGINVNSDNLLITSGSQQALDLLGKIFINRGDRIVVEAPTYLGALQAWNAYGAEYVTVPMDQDGMNTDALEAALRTGPKFIYALPNFQNPSGVTLSLARRQRLVELAERYGVPIVEDDPYGQLRYEGEHLPSLVTLDAQRADHCELCYTGNVIYLSTFSKILAPGLRVAWVVAPPNVIQKLTLAKQGADLQTSTLNQMVIHEMSQGGFLDRHIQVMREVYRARRDAMLSAMQEHFPHSVKWTKPAGGLFLWGILPEGINARHILEAAIQDKVAFVPGAAFYPHGQGVNTMRLNFSNMPIAKIHDGIARLGRVLVRAVGEAEEERVLA
ncbi:PLP-dependent aminotransferase family protein [Anaerolineae bacterium CFX7]|nr:PLP-dependent aminotransferase family protein [Anaerolineae bacterium CFX7]